MIYNKLSYIRMDHDKNQIIYVENRDPQDYYIRTGKELKGVISQNDWNINFPRQHLHNYIQRTIYAQIRQNNTSYELQLRLLDEIMMKLIELDQLSHITKQVNEINKILRKSFLPKANSRIGQVTKRNMCVDLSKDEE